MHDAFAASATTPCNKQSYRRKANSREQQLWKGRPPGQVARNVRGGGQWEGRMTLDGHTGGGRHAKDGCSNAASRGGGNLMAYVQWRRKNNRQKSQHIEENDQQPPELLLIGGIGKY